MFVCAWARNLTWLSLFVPFGPFPFSHSGKVLCLCLPLFLSVSLSPCVCLSVCLFVYLTVCGLPRCFNNLIKFFSRCLVLIPSLSLTLFLFIAPFLSGMWQALWLLFRPFGIMRQHNLHIKANLGAFLVGILGFLIELHGVSTHTRAHTHNGVIWSECKPLPHFSSHQMKTSTTTTATPQGKICQNAKQSNKFYLPWHCNATWRP